MKLKFEEKCNFCKKGKTHIHFLLKLNDGLDKTYIPMFICWECRKTTTVEDLLNLDYKRAIESIEKIEALNNG